ncbi:hypothetical protein NFI96_007066 [Prochilodus magdalenae]|nr:hypothetical protein NFI96_007066 [Prochilodus magdalenae]
MAQAKFEKNSMKVVLQRQLSLRKSVPATWKTTCLIPVPKKAHPKELNDYRPVALTSHVMKTMKRLLLIHLRPQVHHAEDPLQFVYREKPLLLRDKLMKMEVDMHLVTWITDYLTGRPQHVRIRDFSSDTVISSTGAPQGTVLSPEREYRSLVKDFVEWCTTNHLKLNITKTKEMCIDFRRSRPSQQSISIKGVDVEMIRSYRYLGVHLDEKLDWSVNTDTIYKKARSRLYFLRRLWSFRICQKLLLMWSVVASVLFYAVVCWGGSISKRDAGRLHRLLESLTPLAERRALNKLLNIMDNAHHPLHSTIIRQRSSFSGRLLSRSCSTDRLKVFSHRHSNISIMLVPAYHPPLRRSRPTQKTITVWPSDADAVLQDCFGCTDWKVFREAAESEGELDLEDYTSAVLGYISKCVEDVTTIKTVTCYPNRNPG